MKLTGHAATAHCAVTEDRALHPPAPADAVIVAHASQLRSVSPEGTDLASSAYLILYKYTARRVPTNQLKSQPLRGRAYVHMSPPCECWRAPTGFLPLMCEPLFHTVYSLIAKFCLLVNGSISYGERPGGSVLVSRSGSLSVSVKDRSKYRGKHNRGSHGCTSSLGLLGSGKATSRRSSTSSRR